MRRSSSSSSCVYFGVGVWLVFCMVASTQAASLNVWEQKKFSKAWDEQKASGGLYTPEDLVVVLDNNTFYSQVEHSPYAWLVEFYNSWCGFCQRFAPTWKAFAAELKHWEHTVKIAAIDCAYAPNNPICREYEIMQYPTLRYFGPNYSKASDGLGDTLTKSEKQHELQDTLVNHILTKGGISDRMRPLADGERFRGVLVIGAPEAELKLSAEVGLDVASNVTKVRLGQVAGERPGALYVYGDDGTGFERISDRTTRPELVQDIMNFLKIHGKVSAGQEASVRPPLSPHRNVAEKPDVKFPVKDNSQSTSTIRDVVYMDDLLGAVHYMMTADIGGRKVIAGGALTAYRNISHLLSKYLGMTSMLDVLVPGRNLTGEQVAMHATTLYEQHALPPLKSWVGCVGSEPTLRGFTCALWQLFHHLTVLSMERVDNGAEVLHAMHGYVKYFFGCSDCAQHFQQMAARRALDQVHGAPGAKDAVMWLWAAHNEVNGRLVGDKTEDPKHPKIQFPSQQNCPECRDATGEWKRDKVFQYLKLVYGSDAVVKRGARRSFSSVSIVGTPFNTFKSLDMTEVP